MTIACPVCSPCINPDSPYTNLSSELPDELIYIGHNWGWDNNRPPIGTRWQSSACGVAFQSNVSQDDANLQAANEQIRCLIEQPRIPGLIIGGWGKISPVRVYCSLPTVATTTCPDGHSISSALTVGCATSQVVADRIAQTSAMRAVRMARVCLGELSPSRTCVGADYEAYITATTPAISAPFSLVGTLPDGLTMTQYGRYRCKISGTPTRGGSFTFELEVPGRRKSYTIVVMQIVSDLQTFGLGSELHQGAIGSDYSCSLTAIGGVAPLTFALESGNMPPGLSISGAGVISGVPTGISADPFEVVCIDALGVECTQEFTIDILSDDCPEWPSGIMTQEVNTQTGHGGSTVLTGGATRLALQTHTDQYAGLPNDNYTLQYRLGLNTFSNPVNIACRWRIYFSWTKTPYAVAGNLVAIGAFIRTSADPPPDVDRQYNWMNSVDGVSHIANGSSGNVLAPGLSGSSANGYVEFYLSYLSGWGPVYIYFIVQCSATNTAGSPESEMAKGATLSLYIKRVDT